MGKIRVIVKRPGVPGEVTWVDNELKPLQEIVEGYIEVIKYQDLLIICNEEGKIQEEGKSCSGTDPQRDCKQRTQQDRIKGIFQK